MVRQRQQRNVILFFGALLLAGEIFRLLGWLEFAPNALVYRFGRLANFRVSYRTLVALGLVLALTAPPARWLRPALTYLGRTPSLLPGAILTWGGGYLAYRIWPLWSFFGGGCLVSGSLSWLLRRERHYGAERVLAWSATSRAFPFCVAAATALGAFSLNHVLYDGQPHVVDSCARYAHVLMLAQGHWCLPPPADWKWTVQNGMVNDGLRYCSQYQPGGLVIGLLGQGIGSLAIVPALLAGAVALLTYLVGRRIYDEPTAALGSVLLALSGNFLFLAASFMEHTPATFYLMMALWLGLRDLERPGLWNGLGLGLCVGLACMTRSVTTLGWAGPLLAIWAVVRWRRWRWAGLPSWAVAGLGWAVPMAFFLYFNYKTTGHPLQPGYWENNPANRHSLGFTAANGHTPLHGLINQWTNVWALSKWLFFWPGTSYLFLIALFLIDRWTRRDSLVLLPFAGLLTIHFFYPREDFGFSPRQLSEAIPLLALVTARGILEFTRYLRRIAPEAVHGVWRRSMLFLLVALFALSVPRALPLFLKERNDQLNGVDALRTALAPFHSISNATVFLDGHIYAHRAIIDEVECWGRARFLEAPSVAEREEYVRSHPERHCYLVDNSNEAVELLPEPSAETSK